MAYDDDDDDDLTDRELPHASDQDDEDADSVDTVECPACGRDVYEEAQRCPYCGQYLSREQRRRPRPPIWIVTGVIVCVLIVLLVWILR